LVCFLFYAFEEYNNSYPYTGLSWLIGGSLQEVLTSIIFLFVKHPFDVGDKVILNKEMYTVKEIRLLSTIFLDSSSILVQAPNNILNSLVRWNLS
jgi:small-conductance mechanosensitive channel